MPLNCPMLFENVRIFLLIALILIKNLKSSRNVRIVVGLYPSLIINEFSIFNMSCWWCIRIQSTVFVISSL